MVALAVASLDVCFDLTFLFSLKPYEAFKPLQGCVLKEMVTIILLIKSVCGTDGRENGKGNYDSYETEPNGATPSVYCRPDISRLGPTVPILWSRL